MLRDLFRAVIVALRVRSHAARRNPISTVAIPLPFAQSIWRCHGAHCHGWRRGLLNAGNRGSDLAQILEYLVTDRELRCVAFWRDGDLL